MNREQLEAELAILDLSDKLAALKAKVSDGDTSEETQAAYKAAKTELHETRKTLRASRGAPASLPGDGVAAPETLKTTSAVTEVG